MPIYIKDKISDVVLNDIGGGGEGGIQPGDNISLLNNDSNYQTGNQVAKSIGDSIVNDLISSDTTKSLSAAKGKELNDNKQDKLTAGEGISIDQSTNTISLTNDEHIVTISSTTPNITPLPGYTYKCTSPLESLALTNIPISVFDITIYFTTHATNEFSFSADDLDNKWYYINEPEFEADSSYVICISSGKAVLGKIGE